MKLGLKLLQERAKKGTFWWPYISNLPETFTVPIFFSGEDINNLQYAPLLHQVNKRCRFLLEFERILKNTLGNVEPEDQPLRGQDVDASSLGWALSAVSSRAFCLYGSEHPKRTHAEDVRMLLPLIDMCNHSFTPNAEIVQEKEANSDSMLVKVVSVAHIRKEDPLQVNYGCLNNDLFLLDYGFIVPSNPYDCIELRYDLALLGAASTAAGFSSPKISSPSSWQQQLLSQLNLDGENSDLKVRIGGSELVEGRLLAALRVLLSDNEKAIQKHDLETLKSITSVAPLGRSIDIAAFRTLIALCVIALSNFSTKIMEDEALLKQKVPETTELAIRYRIEKKTIIVDAMRDFSMMLRRLSPNEPVADPLKIAHAHSSLSKNPSTNNLAIQFALNELQEFKSAKANVKSPVMMEEEDFSPHKEITISSVTRISHPWPEWTSLMEKLLKNGYFTNIGNPFEKNGILGNKEANSIRTACLNFGRKNYQLIRCLSRKDISVLVESGCPSTDRKVVNSGKRLRAHVGIDEGNACNRCILRGNCDRAYVKARQEEGGRTVDVMRFLLTYGLDSIIGSVENKLCLNKSVKESVRNLLKEMVEIKVEGVDLETTKARTENLISSVEESDVERRKTNVPRQGDWICPKCSFLNFAKNAKCLRCDFFIPERLKRLSEEQENLPLKKGDWKCDKCNMLNFARNTRCYQCKEKPPKRQLILGDWECDSCNYINFRRNMVCLKCDHRRYIVPQQMGNKMKSHQTHLQQLSLHGKQIGDESGHSWKFVENVREHHQDSVSWDEENGFMMFPVVGGESDLSQNLDKQELWKKQMTGERRSSSNADHVKEEDECRYQYPKFLDMCEVASGDDEDDMAEWFKGTRNPAKNCR